MAINSDIRDQAYQFFVEEAPELLQVIESNLLTLLAEKNTTKVHNLMRAAYSLKGGAASVELEAIATLAHRLETIFKALYNEALEIDTELESQLLQAYDCLRLPLIEQITKGEFDAVQALALAEPIFTQIEQCLGDTLNQTENYIPSSAELGVDLNLYIFEVDIQEGLDHLALVISHPQDYEIAAELQTKVEVFAGFSEILDQPEFSAVAQTTLTALAIHPNRALEITQLALNDFQAVRQAVLSGIETDILGQYPRAALLELARSNSIEIESLFEENNNFFPSIEDIFGELTVAFEAEPEETVLPQEVVHDLVNSNLDFLVAFSGSITNTPQTLADAVQEIEQVFDSLPPLPANWIAEFPSQEASSISAPILNKLGTDSTTSTDKNQDEDSIANLSVRVKSEH